MLVRIYKKQMDELKQTRSIRRDRLLLAADVLDQVRSSSWRKGGGCGTPADPRSHFLAARIQVAAETDVPPRPAVLGDLPPGSHRP